MKKLMKVVAFTLLTTAVVVPAANATVRHICNGGMCRTIIYDSSGVVWISDLRAERS